MSNLPEKYQEKTPQKKPAGELNISIGRNENGGLKIEITKQAPQGAPNHQHSPLTSQYQLDQLIDTSNTELAKEKTSKKEDIQKAFTEFMKTVAEAIERTTGKVLDGNISRIIGNTSDLRFDQLTKVLFELRNYTQFTDEVKKMIESNRDFANEYLKIKSEIDEFVSTQGGEEINLNEIFKFEAEQVPKKAEKMQQYYKEYSTGYEMYKDYNEYKTY